MWFSASTFSFQYPLISLRSSSSCLCLLCGLPVIFILPSITCCRRQFLFKMHPIQLAFLLFIACRIFLSSMTPCNILHFSYDWSNWSPSFSSNTFQNFPGISDLLSEVSKFQYQTKLCFKCGTLLASSLSSSPICWWKRVFFLLNAVFPMAILDLILCVHLASFVMLHK